MRLLSALFLCSLTFLSCRDDEDIPGFDLFYQRDFSMPAGMGIFDTHHFYIRNLPTRMEEQLTRNGLTQADIVKVVTTKATLDGIFGDANFDFIDQITLRVFEEANPRNALEIAYRQPVPLEPGNSLPLIPALSDSKEFFKASRVGLDVEVRVRKTSTQETLTRLSLQMRVGK